jgi:dihydroflavonol-4-reductase
MKYFLTGGTGFIGSRIAHRLREQGHDVIALARDPTKASELRSIGVDIRRGDVTDKESMRAPMEGVAGVFHVAGWFKFDDPDPSQGERVNVEGTQNVLELMAEFGIPKGVYTSSVVVNSDTKGKVVDETYRHEGPWMSEYERTKWKAHYEVAEPMIRKGLPLVIVMPGTVYGPGDTSRIRPLFVRYLQGKLRAIPRGTAQSWSYVDDVAEGHVLAMDRGRPGEKYLLAGPAHSLVEAFDIAEGITGIPAPRFHPSPRFLRAIAAITRSEWMRVAAGVTYLGSSEKAQRELGFRSRSFESGLRETLRHEKALLEISRRPRASEFPTRPSRGSTG